MMTKSTGSNSTHKKVKARLNEVARSTPVKWVASIASGAGLASGVHYCIALAEELAPWVRIANYAATAVIFIIGTAVTSAGFDLSITSMQKVKEKVEIVEDSTAKLEAQIKQQENEIGLLSRTNWFLQKQMDIFSSHISLPASAQETLAEIRQKIEEERKEEVENEGYIEIEPRSIPNNILNIQNGHSHNGMDYQQLRNAS